jgi:hypothetical protein
MFVARRTERDDARGRQFGVPFWRSGRMHRLRLGRWFLSCGGHRSSPESKRAITLYRMMALGSTLSSSAGYIIHSSSAG